MFSLLLWQGWSCKICHRIATSPLFTWKCHSSRRGTDFDKLVCQSLKGSISNKSGHFSALVGYKAIQSLWNGAETGLTFWDGFIGNIRLSAEYTACASLPEDVDVIQSQSAGNVYGSMGGYWAPISMGS